MFDHSISIYRFQEVRDEYNDRTHQKTLVALCYAQRTEAGGRENLYAGRIVHENEVVVHDPLPLRHHSRDARCRTVQSLRKITSVQEEGRRWRLHIVTVKSDADGQG
jgi:hypothetical protein